MVPIHYYFKFDDSLKGYCYETAYTGLLTLN